jgi:ArsR family transcriptional regulator
MVTNQPSTNLQYITEMLKVLAEPKRLLILDLLMKGVQCNCELGGSLQMAPNLISHHLNVLREAGLIKVERDSCDARWLYYSINEEAVQQLVSILSEFLDLKRIQPRSPVCGPQREQIKNDTK